MVARVPASSEVLLPPPSSELECDGSGAGAVCTSNPSPYCLFVFLLFSPCCNGIFVLLQQMILECCNKVIDVLQKGSSNVGIVAMGDFNC